jgi:hypothetical protein
MGIFSPPKRSARTGENVANLRVPFGLHGEKENSVGSLEDSVLFFSRSDYANAAEAGVHAEAHWKVILSEHFLRQLEALPRSVRAQVLTTIWQMPRGRENLAQNNTD